MFEGSGARWSQYAKIMDVSKYTDSLGSYVDYDSFTGLLASGSQDGECC